MGNGNGEMRNGNGEMTFDPTMRFKRSNSNLENFHDVFGIAAFSLLLTPWRDIS